MHLQDWNTDEIYVNCIKFMSPIGTIVRTLLREEVFPSHVMNEHCFIYNAPIYIIIILQVFLPLINCYWIGLGSFNNISALQCCECQHKLVARYNTIRSVTKKWLSPSVLRTMIKHRLQNEIHLDFNEIQVSQITDLETRCFVSRRQIYVNTHTMILMSLFVLGNFNDNY